MNLQTTTSSKDLSLEEMESKYQERFLIIFLEQKFIILESENFIYLLENINSNSNIFNPKSYFLSKGLIIDILDDFKTDNFIIFENNQIKNQDDYYHFFYLDKNANFDKNKMYLTEMYSKSNLVFYIKI